MEKSFITYPSTLMESDEWDEIEYNQIPIRAEHYQIDRIDELLQYSAMDNEHKEHWYKALYSLTYPEADLLIKHLEGNQIDRITGGLNYNMTEIIKHQKKLK